MGRAYTFDCPKCSFRARVSGGEDQGNNCFVQTHLCQECGDIYDLATYVRWPTIPSPPTLSPIVIPQRVWPPRSGLKVNLHGYLPDHIHASGRIRQLKPRLPSSMLARPPSPRWVQLELQCPKAQHHHLQPWQHPGRCPKCGTFLEQSVVPFRLWD